MYYFIAGYSALAFLYCWFIYRVRNQWSYQLDSDETADIFDHVPDVTVIVIVRNEEVAIGDCVRSILANKTEALSKVIIVDDHSDDRTADIIRGIDDSRITLLHLADFGLLENYNGKFKKAGLHYALTQCSTELVLTTDGDCMVRPQWIEAMLTHNSTKQVDTLTGPILIGPAQGFLESFQQIEMIGTIAGTLAGISTGTYHSANAANMLFSKREYLDFLELYPHQHASGDDVFFVQWQQEQGKKLSFVQDESAIVETAPEANLKALYAQRLRWASKTTSYQHIGLTILMGSIFLFYLSIVAFPVIGVLINKPVLIMLGFVLLLFKVVGDVVLLRSVAPFFGVTYGFGIRSIVLTFLHLCYVVLIGFAGLTFKSYSWKGRKVS